jgi:hypothetical protein
MGRARLSSRAEEREELTRRTISLRPLVRFAPAGRVRFTPGGLKLRKAASALSLSEPVAGALIRQGHIKTEVVKNPSNRQKQVVVMPSEIEAFREKYVPGFLLSRERRMHPTAVKRAMERAGAKPAFDPDAVGGWIYRRKDVPASLGT